MVLRFGKQFVCIDVESGLWHIANAAGSEIFAYHSDGVCESEIVNNLARKYDVAPARLKREVSLSLDTFRNPDAVVKSRQSHVKNYSEKPNRCINATVLAYYQIGGVFVEILSESAEIITLLSTMLFSVASKSRTEYVNYSKIVHIYAVDGEFPIIIDGTVVDAGTCYGSAAARCVRALMIEIVESCKSVVTFHAAAVSKGNCAVLLPAVGGSGKTTLTSFLISENFKLINDDIVPLSCETFKLKAFPTSLCVKEGSWSVISNRFPELGRMPVVERSHDQRVKYLYISENHVQTSDVSCGVIVFPKYNSNTRKVICRRLGHDIALAGIAKSGCVLGEARNVESMSNFLEWLESIPCYELIYNSLEDATCEIEKLIEAHPVDNS